jgi:glycosyltransferase involved in cell wall biosynthesis
MTIPFVRSPPEELYRQMEHWERFPYESLWVRADRIIPLKFPTYYGVDARTVWLLHEFREAYDLIASSYAPNHVEAVRAAVLTRDKKYLSRAHNLYTVSKNVARRVKRNIGVEAEPLYHPCPGIESFFCGDQQPYIFAPSRLETLKRQSLLIEAMALCKSPVLAVVAGEGTQGEYLKQLAEQLGVSHRVVFPGVVTGALKFAMYAHCLAVYFAPYDEDYGYITLEAMLSGKPVISAKDSGGPMEFVVDGETGYVVEPNAAEVAERIDQLYSNPVKARQLGSAGLEHYHAQQISWDYVVEKLMA